MNRPIPSDLEFVADLGVQWLRRPVPTAPGLVALLAQDALNPEEHATVVQAVGASVADACATHGYHSMDLVVLHPATPGLEAALQRFDQPYTHADDEVRYILEGERIFGFLDAQGEERVVCVRAVDYLRVPAGGAPLHTDRSTPHQGPAPVCRHRRLGRALHPAARGPSGDEGVNLLGSRSADALGTGIRPIWPHPLPPEFDQRLGDAHPGCRTSQAWGA